MKKEYVSPVIEKIQFDFSEVFAASSKCVVQYVANKIVSQTCISDEPSEWWVGDW